MLLRTAKQLEGHALRARDGTIGEVKDFYFDDRHWRIRYCVVETGRWLQSRKVLISPVVMGDYDSALQVFPVDLTMDQVRNSPDIDTNKPVSRQNEELLRSYYGWPGYWGGALIAPIATPTVPANSSEPALTDDDLPPRERGDPFLRSVNDTRGYQISAANGTIGHVEDFLIDDEDWLIRYLVVDTRNVWPGRKVVIAPTWISDVSWENSQVAVDLTREAIKASPLYEPSMPWSEEYAGRLHEHYGRPSESVREQKQHKH